MTFSTDTTGKDALGLILVVEVQGLPYSFVEEPLTGGATGDLGAGRSQLAVIDDISFGRSSLDLSRRQAVGGSLQIVLRDDNDNTLREGPFRSRLSPRAWLTSDVEKADVMSGAGTLNVNTSSSLDSPGYVIIGGEAFTYTGKTSTTLTGVTRAALDTRAQAHFGGTSFGTASQVFASPPSWEGRRVRVLGGYKRGDGSVAELETLGTWRMLEPPQPDEQGLWTIQCGELSDWYREAPVGLGLREVPAEPETRLGTSFSLPADSVAQFRVGGMTTYVEARTESGYVNLKALSSVAADSITVTGANVAEPSSPPSVSISGSDASGGAGAVTSLRHVALLTGSPTILTAILLLSDEGQEDNAYDLLPGNPRAGDGDNGWRMGAGLHIDDVDITSFTRVGLGSSLWSWRVYLDEPTTVGAILDELTLAIGGYWYVTAAGKIAVARLRDRVAPSEAVASVQVDDDLLDVGDADGLSHSEDAVFHTMQLAGSYDGLLGKHLVRLHVVDWDLKERFREAAKVFVHESPFAMLDSGNITQPVTVGSRLPTAPGAKHAVVEVALRRLQTGGARGAVDYAATAAWPAAVLELGDVVSVTNARLPDLEGSTLSGSLFMVVSRRLVRNKAQVELGLRLLEPGYLWAPSAVVSAWDGGTKTLTLTTTEAFDASGGSPTDYFAAGQEITIYDLSGGALERETISSISSGTELVLVAAPSFTPAAGDVVSVSTGGSQVDNANGFDKGDYLFQTDLDGSRTETRLI